MDLVQLKIEKDNSVAKYIKIIRNFDRKSLFRDMIEELRQAGQGFPYTGMRKSYP